MEAVRPMSVRGSNHLRYFELHVPSPERVREAHTRMTASDFIGTGLLPHREYTQSTTEGCYLCALLYEIEELKKEIRFLRQGGCDPIRVGGLD